jgi:hypothetical protein
MSIVVSIHADFECVCEIRREALYSLAFGKEVVDHCIQSSTSVGDICMRYVSPTKVFFSPLSSEHRGFIRHFQWGLCVVLRSITLGYRCVKLLMMQPLLFRYNEAWTKCVYVLLLIQNTCNCSDETLAYMYVYFLWSHW